MSGDWWYRGRRNHIHYMRSKRDSIHTQKEKRKST
nr:MAG TPA: hypothetical protein [Caudoviricetes sp.]